MSSTRFTRAALAVSVALASTTATAAVIEEIVVTATKRSANVQDVPIAVTALDAVQLDRAGVKDLRDLPTLSPSFNMNSTQTESQGTTLRLRGVGTTGNNIGLESAVGVFLDGVYLSRPGVALGDLFDVEQIEVLRGPQGTLFGRNTSAGALSIKTKKPLLGEKEFFANGTYGNFDAYSLQAGASVPLIENELAVRLSGAVRKADGFTRSVTTDAESVTRDRYTLRGQALWVPRDDMDFRLILDYADAEEQCCDAAIVVETPVAAAGAFAASGLPANGGVVASGDRAVDKRQTNSEQFENPFEQYGASLEWNWDLDLGTLTYIGSYRNFEASSTQFTDFNSLDAIRVPGSNGFGNFDKIETISHELRMQGVAGRLDWLVGGYYATEDIDALGTLELGTDYGQYISSVAWFGGILPIVGGTLDAVPLATGGTFADVRASTNPAVVFAGGVDPVGSFGANQYSQDSRSWSVFTHNTFQVTENFDIVFGLRWNDEKKDGTYNQLAGSSPACLNTLANAAALPADAALVGQLAAGFMCFPFAAQADIPGTPLPQSFDDTFEDDELTYTLKGVYAFDENITGYASVSHGFKTGGFNLDSTAAVGGADPRFDSETVDAWEIGLKTDLFDRSVRANVAAFYMEMEDFQVLEFTGVQFTTFNVPTAESQGVELEVLWSPLDELDLNFAWTWADAAYPNDCAPATARADVTSLCGNDLTNAPEHVVVTGLNWEDQVPGTNLSYFVNGSVRWEDDRRTSTQAVIVGTTTPLAEDIQEANAKVNLRIGLEQMSGLWTLELWANNLFDEQTKNVTFNTPLRGTSALGTGSRAVFFDAPRTYGLTLRTMM
jgi:outer membrane receptor protein involved in Fe transport